MIYILHYLKGLGFWGLGFRGLGLRGLEDTVDDINPALP